MRPSLLSGSLALASGLAATIAVASPAAASNAAAHCWVKDGIPNECTTTAPATSAAFGTFTDRYNRFCVTDDRRDGHSVLVKMWPKGGSKSQLWNKSGRGTTSCLNSQSGQENSVWFMKVCIGEWNQTVAKSTILDCGARERFRL